MDLRSILFVLFIAALTFSEEIDEGEGEGGVTTISRKERFLLATLKFRNERCEKGQVSGVCKSWKECWKGRGNAIGSCPLGHGVCCSYDYTCGNTTSERVSYFNNPNVFVPYCTLRVNVYDRRVTQIRLDFEIFSLAQPTSMVNAQNIQYQAYFCRNDTFTVISSSAGGSTNLGFVSLCGENAGQHIYVPVNATLGPASVELIFNMADRNNNINVVAIQPRWRIKVSQIDCAAPDTRDLCAPAGCLQYYPNRSGIFRSFNYNNGAGRYQGLLNYAICFKRYDGVCSIRYDANTFQLAADDMTVPYGESGCNVATTSTVQNSQDYLFIPEGIYTANMYSSLYCGDGMLNHTVTTNAPGPQFVFFRTDGTANEQLLGDEAGFEIQYQQSGSGCYGTGFAQGFGG